MSGIDYPALLAWSGLALAAWCVLSSAQWIVQLPAYRPGAPLGWDVVGVRTAWPDRSALLARLFASPVLVAVPWLRLAAGVALPFVEGAGVVLGLLAVIAAATIVLGLLADACDGADKIALVVVTGTGAMVAGLAIGDPWLACAGLVWIAGQLAIAYGTAGAAKIVRRWWRDGSALQAAMTSHGSGHPLAAAVVRVAWRARLMAWGLMLLECAFPFALLLAPPPLFALVLAVFALFHVATAVFMRLNTYPLAFVAAYPAALAVNAAAWRLLSA